MKNKVKKCYRVVLLSDNCNLCAGVNLSGGNSELRRFNRYIFAGILMIILILSVISCGCTDNEPDVVKGSDACSDFSGVCSCAGNCYDCQDFDSKSDAQRCYDYCMSIGKGDVHGIDKDSDGVACNSVLEEDTPVREEPDYKNPDSMTKHDALTER
ncbi:hypothetical protein [Methanoplanus endosymbiosus]|uniref:Excalibur calcium-binding domain-containing protein n=1 Tax=Methanoplanus endosymbiosus TaxID=33865 RepID=A0A9E7PQA7_9EURY|nr:hypothetical protein [Methanoplanus endosymbiosus]UUX93039.1 hypothetical protein L6E24_02655 [Methanoplanus endosymbiosus]